MHPTHPGTCGSCPSRETLQCRADWPFPTVTLSHVICDPAGNHLPWTPLAARRSPRRHRYPHLRWNSSDYRGNTHLALFGTRSLRNTICSIRPKVIHANASVRALLDKTQTREVSREAVSHKRCYSDLSSWFNMTRNGPTRKRDTIVVGNERKICNKKCDQKCVYHNKRILMKMLFKNCFKDHLQTNGKMITNCMNSEFYIKRYWNNFNDYKYLKKNTAFFTYSMLNCFFF